MTREVSPFRNGTVTTLGDLPPTGGSRGDLHIRDGVSFPPKFYWRTIFLLLGLFCLWPLADAAGAPRPKRVIIAHSFYGPLHGYAEFGQRLRSKIQSNYAAHIDFYTEYLDLNRAVSPEAERRLVSSLRELYSQRQTDLIVAISLPALNFVLKHRQELFPRTPIVFTFIPEGQVRNLPQVNLTGVCSPYERGKTLEAALRLQPGTRRVFVPVGSSRFEKAREGMLRESLQQFEGQVEVLYLKDLTFNELVESVSHLPPNSLIFYQPFFQDYSGDYYDPTDALEEIAKNANAPVYADFEYYVGRGIVGGYVASSNDVAIRTAQMCVRVLSGENPDYIPYVTFSPFHYIFDWRQLRRWQASESNLPAGSKILYREPSLWESHKRYVYGALALIFVETLLVAGLLLSRARQKRAEKSLIENLSVQKLVASFSGGLVNLPASEVDPELERGLAQVGEFLDADRVDFLEYASSNQDIRSAICWSREGFAEGGTKPRMVNRNSWLSERLLGAETVFFTALQDLPDEAASVKESCRERGIKSGAVIPIKSGQSVMGVLAIYAIREERCWSESVLRQVRTIAEICLQALQRKRVEEELHASEALKKSILQSLDSGVVVLMGEGRVIAVNAAWSQIGHVHGIDSKDISPGVSYIELLRKAIREGHSDAATALAGIQDVLDSSVPEFQEEFSSDPPECLWFLMSVTPLNSPGGGVVVCYKNITARRDAELAWLESEARFQRVSESMPIMIWMSREDGQRTYFNHAWLEFTGRAVEQEIDTGWQESIHPDDVHEYSKVLAESVEARRSFRMDYRLRRADGTYRWVSVHGVPRVGVDDSFQGHIATCIDITELKLAQEAIQGVSSRLILAQEEERRRVARELHDDISQRMALLTIDLEQLAQSPPQSTAELRAKLRALWTGTDEVSTEIHRLSRQLHPSILENLGLESAVRSYCREVKSYRKLQVHLKSENIPRSLPSDTAVCLYRVLQEALQNVVKHSESPIAEVNLTADQEAVTLQVIDVGAGFDLGEAQERGGLGLISMGERLRAVGGRIEIFTERGRGTHVKAQVPLPPKGQEGRSSSGN